jgi:hypothetical protein
MNRFLRSGNSQQTPNNLNKERSQRGRNPDSPENTESDLQKRFCKNGGHRKVNKICAKRIISRV